MASIKAWRIRERFWENVIKLADESTIEEGEDAVLLIGEEDRAVWDLAGQSLLRRTILSWDYGKEQKTKIVPRDSKEDYEAI